MLNVSSVSAGYNGVPALVDVSLHVDQGEIVAIVGSNGTGKSTLARVVRGWCARPQAPSSSMARPSTACPPHDIVRLGLIHVPEGRHVFGKLTVAENLRLGAYTESSDAETRRRMELVFNLFPILRERMNQKAGSLSGGQQQMLALGRGLMAKPKLLVLDEPSLGLMPKLCDELFEAIRRINDEGIAVLLIERGARALEMASRGYVIRTAVLSWRAPAASFWRPTLVRKAYLGM